MQVVSVHPDGIAAEIGIKPGDRILAINGEPVTDILDYLYLTAGEEIVLELEHAGETWEVEIEKDYDENLGLEVEMPVMRSCANRCIFCFVDQMPAGLRPTLYCKDDDYRYSFLAGQFVTLTGLGRKDLERIKKYRLSPLYVSVHTTNPKLREKIMGNRQAGKIMELLTELAAAGIQFHTQAVLMPGINDGEELERTIRDLSRLGEALLSLAVVPVGLTAYREGLYPLRPFTPAEAGEVLTTVHRWQEYFYTRRGQYIVHAADEFYLLANKPFPPADRYEGFPQLENGVGMAVLFWDEFASIEKFLPRRLSAFRRVKVVTGVSGAKVVGPVLSRLENQVANLRAEMVVVENSFFGPTVTVTGLLTGRDIAAALRQNKEEVDAVLLPSHVLKRDEPLFLDGMTLADLEKEAGGPVLVVDMNRGAEDFVGKVLGVELWPNR